jgi:hypothetical protein
MERKEVTVIAVNKLYIDVTYPLSPVYDAKKGYFNTGQEDILQIVDEGENTWNVINRPGYDKLVKEGRFVNPFESINITHNMKLNVLVDNSNKKEWNRDDYIYYIMLSIPTIFATDTSNVVSGQHIYLIVDRYKSADIKISKGKKVKQALSLLDDNMSLENLSEIAIYLELNDVKNQPKNVLEGYILEKAQNNPDVILAYYNDKKENNGLVGMLKQLIYYGVLIRKADGSVWNEKGTVLLGHNFDNALTYMSNSKNEEYVAVWLRQLKDKLK